MSEDRHLKLQLKYLAYRLHCITWFECGTYRHPDEFLDDAKKKVALGWTEKDMELC